MAAGTNKTGDINDMGQKRIHVTVDEDHVKWFEDKFQGASISWWINLLMEKGREVMTLTPEDYARLAAERLKESMKDG